MCNPTALHILNYAMWSRRFAGNANMAAIVYIMHATGAPLRLQSLERQCFT